MLAMVLHPEVMRRAQEQLDAVVGRDRLPVVGDKNQLPYISAIVKEVLRWSPVVPLAIPKLSTQVCLFLAFLSSAHSIYVA